MLPEKVRLVPEEQPSFWGGTATWLKFVFIGLIALVVFLLVRKFRKFRKFKNMSAKKPPHVVTPTIIPTITPTGLQHQSGRVHIGIPVYRCDPRTVAQTIFGAFEAADFPENVHVWIYQELQASDGGADGFGVYKQIFAKHHTKPRPARFLRNIHVKNQNATDSGGPLVSFLTLARDQILTTAAPNDAVVMVRPFYESLSTTHIYGVTFVQHYDATVLGNPLGTGVVFTSRLPRSSLQGSDVTHKTLEHGKLTSLSSIIVDAVAIPMIKNKINHIEVISDNVCTFKTFQHMIQKQAGFIGWTTMDREMKSPIAVHRTRSAAKIPVPFTRHRKFTKFAKTDQSDQSDQSQHIVGVVGLHIDIQIMSAGTLRRIVNQALESPDRYVFAVPYHAYTLVLSNLCLLHQGGFYSANHLGIGCIIDHIQGLNSSAVDSPQTIQATMAFRPKNWKLIPKQRKQSKILDLIPTEDFQKILPVSRDLIRYAGVASDNLTVDGFLGITSDDSLDVLRIKFGSSENLARQRRMLG